VPKSKSSNSGQTGTYESKLVVPVLVAVWFEAGEPGGEGGLEPGKVIFSIEHPPLISPAVS